MQLENASQNTKFFDTVSLRIIAQRGCLKSLLRQPLFHETNGS